MQGNALYAYFQLLKRTSRWRIEGQENRAAAQASGRPILWSFWHGQGMPFITFADRFMENRDFVAITVGDERGDTLGTLGQRLGATSYGVDMQGNPFAAGRAVVRVIQAMQQGHQSVLAPDGPDGPVYVAKPGITVLARKAEAAILPAGVWAHPALHLNRWDRYQIPLPFARCHITIGSPIFVNRDTDPDALLAQLSDALHANRHRAQVLAGVRPSR